MDTKPLNRQTKLHYEGETGWVGRGNVTFKQAAIEAVKTQNAQEDIASDGAATVCVRCSSDPRDVRVFRVVRKPVEYTVEGLRGGM